MVEGGRQRDWHVAAQDLCSNACQLTKCEPSCSGFGGDGVAITPLTEQSAGRASTRTGAPGGRAAPRAKRNGGGALALAADVRGRCAALPLFPFLARDDAGGSRVLSPLSPFIARPSPNLAASPFPSLPRLVDLRGETLAAGCRMVCRRARRV